MTQEDACKADWGTQLAGSRPLPPESPSLLAWVLPSCRAEGQPQFTQGREKRHEDSSGAGLCTPTVLPQFVV